MKNIVILGQSCGVYELAKSLRQADDKIEIVIVSLDGQMPHHADLLSDYLEKKMSKQDLLCADKNFYESHHIEVITDQTLDKLSLRQKKLTMESKQSIKFDQLVVADSSEFRFVDVKGVHKQGVFHTRSLGAVEQFQSQLPFAKSIVIQIHHWNDLKIAMALKVYAKDVSVIVPFETRMAEVFEHGVCENILQSLSNETWKVFYGQSIQEVLGDSEAKAVRLSSGKVLASDITVICRVEPRLRLFEDLTGTDFAVAVSVNEKFQTKDESVYVFGSISLQEHALQIQACAQAEEEKHSARRLSDVLSGRSNADQISRQNISMFSIGTWLFKMLGDITPRTNVMTFRFWNPETKIYQKIFTCNGVIKGAVLINSADEEKYQRLISEAVVIYGFEKQVFDSSISVEQLKEMITNPPKISLEDEELSEYKSFIQR